MKLNGALKPRQGASKQGCSPGVVFKEYRVKRYFKMNIHVVNGLPLNARGAKNQKSFYGNNAINNNNFCTNNPRRAITPLSHQLELKGKCCETTSRCIHKNSSKIDFTDAIRKPKPNNVSAHDNITRTGVSAVTKAEICHNNVRTRSKDIDEITEKQANFNRKINIPINSELEAVIDITARQRGNTKLEDGRVKKESNCTTNNGMEENHVDNRGYEKKKNTNKQANNFLFAPKINETTNIKAIIRRLFIELKLILFSILLNATKHFKGKLFTHFGGRLGLNLVGYNFAKMMCTSQLLVGAFKCICLKNAKGSISPVALFMVIYAATAILLPHAVVGDEGDAFFPINGIETTTPEFDYASRGQKKFGDKCENTLECGFPGSICDPKKKSCQCTEDLPVTNHIDKCGKEAAVNESCFFNEQCEVKYFQTECRDQRCVCRFDMTPVWLKDGSVECKGRGDKKGPETYIDPAMIGVLIGMALMFIIICVVLRLFSQARWRENRTIFNTPNPRLMNVSLLRESKLLHGQERRGSRMSVRAPSRQPSMASLRPHSPNPSLGSRSNSHGSNASATSLRSTRSNCVSPAGITVGNNSQHERKGSTYQPHQHHHSQQQKLQTLQQEDEPNSRPTNIISNPVAETVTVEIIEPEKFTKSTE